VSIHDILKKINPGGILSQIRAGFEPKEDIFIVLAIILIGLAGFGLGRLSALEKGRERVEIQPIKFTSLTTSSTTRVNEQADHPLVASKTGKKYHFPWCAGALQIADKNKIYFDSYEQAQKAGYTPASNCPGLI
jgi:hypothetical protein